MSTPMCGKRTAHFICTLPAGHGGPHGRAYRRQEPPAIHDDDDTAAERAERDALLDWEDERGIGR